VAHGIPVGNSVCATLSGAAPSGLTTNQAYYIRALSTTTLAMYNLLSDAKSDINRITGVGSGTTGWNLRVFIYSGTLSSGFDAVCPIGAQTGVGGIRLELNLSTALAGLFALTSIAHATGIFDNGGTPATRGNWYPGVNPTIVSTTLIRFDAATWIVTAAGVAAVGTVSNPGSWASQTTTAFYIEFLVIG
jgi:hypothetical protein